MRPNINQQQRSTSVSLLFLFLLSSCHKTSVSLSILSRKPKKLKLSNEIGISPVFNNKFFDPFTFANEDNFAKYREAELKHGRISMFATIGMFLPDFLSDRIHNIQQQVMISPSNHLKFSDVPYGLKALQVVPWGGWVQIIILLGILETQVFIQKNAKDMPGDYQVGYFGLIDKGRHERLLYVELENGRVAMIAFLVQVILELTTGVTVGEQWKNVFHAVFA